MSLQSRLSALITAIGADIKALKTQSSNMVRVRRANPNSGGNYTVANASIHVVTWDTEEKDTTGNGWSASTPTRLTAQVAGPHTIVGQVGWPSGNAAGGREIWIMKNGNGNDRLGDEVEFVGQSGDVRRQRVVTVVWLDVGDYVELALYQASGSTLNMEMGQGFHFAMTCSVGSKGDTGPAGAFGADVAKVQLWQTAGHALTVNQFSPISYDTEYDPFNMHVAGSSRVYALYTGRHLITAVTAISAGQGSMGLRKNGDANPLWSDKGQTGARCEGTWQIDLAVGDYIEVGVYVEGAASANTIPDVNKVNTRMEMTAMAGVKGDKGDSGSVTNLTPDEYNVTTGQQTVDGDSFKWVRQSSGAVVLEEFTQVGDMGDGTFVTEDYKQVRPVSASRGASMSVGVENGSLQSRVQMVDGGSGAANPKRYVRAYVAKDSGVGVESRIIVASDGTSDFQKFIPVVTSLPSSGTDGQECYYRFQDAQGVYKYWHMKYDANEATAYKWKWIAGDPYYKKLGTNLSRTNTSAANVWADLATGILGYTVPWQGDWEVEFGCTAMWNDTANSYAVFAVGIGAFSAPTDNSFVRGHYNGAAAGFTDYGPRGQKTMEAVAQGDEIRIRFTRRAATGTANFQEPIWMSVRPVRGNRVLV